MVCLSKNCQHADYKTILKFCQENKIKLTPLREMILFIVGNADKPLTAYEILEVLREQKPKAQVMSVYRILDFLLENELIHRIESLNAVMLCHHRENKNHLSQWLICTQCHQAVECDLPIFQQGVAELTQQTGFSVTMPMIELSGICQHCQQS